MDGALVVVDRSLEPRDGDIAVVDVDGDRSFAIWGRRGGRVTLAFANSTYSVFSLSADAVVEV